MQPLEYLDRKLHYLHGFQESYFIVGYFYFDVAIGNKKHKEIFGWPREPVECLLLASRFSKN